jgi:putative acetyltransferase
VTEPGPGRTRPALLIRRETPADHAAVHDVHEQAFGRAAEADLVDKIRASDRAVPALSLVADLEGLVVGHVLLSYVDLEQRGGPVIDVLLLAPLGVLPEHQRKGIGERLVQGGVDEAEAREEPVILVQGHPWYYPRFRFERARPLGFEPPDPGLDSAWMARRLARWSPEIRGRVRYPPVFDDV